MAERTIVIDVYGAPRCSLCDEALEVLERLAPELDLEIRKIDISRDADLEGTYRREIPVVMIEGERVYTYRIDEADLRARVARLRAGGSERDDQ